LRKRVSRKSAKVAFTAGLILLIPYTILDIRNDAENAATPTSVVPGQPLKNFKSSWNYQLVFPSDDWVKLNKGYAQNIMRLDLSQADLVVGKIGGTAYGFLVAEDITERVMDADALARSREFLQRAYFARAKNIQSYITFWAFNSLSEGARQRERV
jgi:hypothetical protein